MSTVAPIPFRWDVTRREQLGRLPEVEPAAAYPGFLDELRRLAARVAFEVGDAEEVFFVGRSPESLFDYLTGASDETSWSRRWRMLNVSLRDDLSRDEVRALRAHLAALALDPAALLHRDRPAALVDLVWTGRTLANVVGVLRDWSRAEKLDPPGVARKLVVVGIPEKRWTKNWREEHEPLRWLPMSAKRCIAIPGRLWRFMGDDQQKVARSYPPELWGDARAALPPPASDLERRAALRFALDLYRWARTRTEREALVHELGRVGSLRSRCVRSFVNELRTARHITISLPQRERPRSWLRGDPHLGRAPPFNSQGASTLDLPDARRTRNRFALIPTPRFVTVETLPIVRANMRFA